MSQDWAYACLEYAELASSKGQTELGVRIGLAMKKQALESLGKNDQTERVADQIEQRKEELHKGKLFNRLVMANPAIFALYLNTLRQHGELEPIYIMEEEIARLLEIQPELACYAIPFYDL